jgi:hypothetical protein
MTGGHQRDVEGENIYLRQRNAQLEGDVVSLQAEVQRLRQMLDRMHDPRAPRTAHAQTQRMDKQ